MFFKQSKLAGLRTADGLKSPAWTWLPAVSIVTLCCWFTAESRLTGQSPARETREFRYETRAVHDPDGIGKFYFGREIAQVMGHQGAEWLERPERQSEEHSDQMVDVLPIKPGETVADIGAGTGYLTWRLAKKAGPTGTVLAVDIQPEMLHLLTNNMAMRSITNVTPVLGTEMNPGLKPGSVDVALMVDVYHEFAFPYEMMSSLCAALRPGGRVVFVEYRKEDPQVPIKPLHKMSEAQVRREMSEQPVRWAQTLEVLPRQHIIIFVKRG